MPLGLGIAVSHAPSMLLPAEQWGRMHEILAGNVPQPPELAVESGEVVASYVERINKGFATLEQRLIDYEPDALIIVGDDQNEVFSKAIEPQVAIYLGTDMSGTTSLNLFGEPLAENHISLKCHQGLATYLIEELVTRGFDVCPMYELEPLSRPAGGLGHAFTRPCRALNVHEREIPVIPLFLNSYHPPLPTAHRCYQLGRKLREVTDECPERIAILGSGGLSHDPKGPRAGWIDVKLDRWVLEQVERGRARDLTHLFTFESDALHGGTGEIRSWIATAAAFDRQPAVVVDYIPAYHAVTGLGFAYWMPQQEDSDAS